MSINPSNTLQELLNQFAQLRIPTFQRNYDWTAPQWEEFLADALAVKIQNGGALQDHYLGAVIVLQDSNSADPIFVVDGQQRLATVTMLLLAIRKLCEALANGEYEVPEIAFSPNDKTRLTRDVVNKIAPLLESGAKRKLILNESDEERFEVDVFNVNWSDIADRPKNAFRGSKCLELFVTRVMEELKASSPSDANQVIDFLRDLYIKIAEGMRLTLITVSEDWEAYEVFESLNSKGQSLSSADLLKNRLISVYSDNKAKKEEVQKKWAQLAEVIKNSRFNLVDYLWSYWMAFESSKTTKRMLYKDIKNKLQAGDIEPLTFLEDLLQSAEPFSNWTDRDASRFPPSNEGSVLTQTMGEINILQYSSCWPLLLYAEREHKTILDRTAWSSLAFLFRTITICGERTQVAERAFAEALSILKGSEDSEATLLSIKEVFRREGVNDEDFLVGLKSAQVDSRVGRYIWSKMYCKESGGEMQLVPATVHLDHILPQQPDPNWLSFSVKDDNGDEIDGTSENRKSWARGIERSVHSVGNMCLIRDKLNQSMSNKNAADKLPLYRRSQIPQTMRVASMIEGAGSTWTNVMIQERTQEVMDKAITIWNQESPASATSTTAPPE